MQVEGWAYAMSQKGRTFNLHGHVFQWTGVRIQKIKVVRKVLEFSVGIMQDGPVYQSVTELSPRHLTEIESHLNTTRKTTQRGDAV
jgi:hypothetical protein